MYYLRNPLVKYLFTVLIQNSTELHHHLLINGFTRADVFEV